MPRKPATKASVLQMPARINDTDPQPPQTPMSLRRARVPNGSILEHNREQMFLRFRRGTLPRSLAATFGTSEAGVCQIINEQFELRLSRRAA